MVSLYNGLKTTILATMFLGLGGLVADLQAEADYADELPRVPATEPAAAINTFQLIDGFKMELVAAEPQVTDPVAMAFDENGNLFVAEMRGYSEHGDDQVGQIRFLEDTNGDGLFDRSTVFADRMSWPTAVACYDGGIFVGATPDLLYLKDENGDRQADRREVVLSGFGASNVQGLINSFRWGLDNRIHLVVRNKSAIVRPGDQVAEEPLLLSGRDLIFDPRTLEYEPTSGGGQFGMSFNRWGEKFVCSNSDHLQVVLAEERYLRRNPYQAGGASRRSIATDGPQAAVYRISPVEAWRIVRTRLRVAKAASGLIEGGGTPSGYFTSATGITIYEGDAWPDAYRGWALIADVGSNLLHRKQLHPDGVTYLGYRVDQQTEFLASTDIWFRPVQFCNGPDGALYIADMYREVVEHPLSLPPEIKRHLDLNSGSDRGRIYRVVPTDFKQPVPTRLGGVSPGELVKALDHPNAWHRRTAARLIYQRQDAQVVPALQQLAAQAKLPEGRIGALYALEGLGALNEQILLAVLGDDHLQVRRNGVRLAESYAPLSLPLREKLLTLVNDPAISVRYQLAFSLGEWPSSESIAGLIALARRDVANKDINGALLSSLRNGAQVVLAELNEDPQFASTKEGQAFLDALREQVARQSDADDTDEVMVFEVIGGGQEPIRNKVPEERKLVYDAYRPVLGEPGNIARGRELFKQSCASCHKLENVGQAIGPNLAAMKNRGSESLLYNTLIPNQEVDPRFQTRLVVTGNGQTFSGIIQQETATSVTLIGADGVANTILRIDIEEMVNTGKSLMPSGFENQLSKAKMTDLMSYLMSLQ
jgi:putative membrane-bound dehydrogenase-like protein